MPVLALDGLAPSCPTRPGRPPEASDDPGFRGLLPMFRVSELSILVRLLSIRMGWVRRGIVLPFSRSERSSCREEDSDRSCTGLRVGLL